MKKYSTVIIGGGAAGICAAIGKARRGESVLICERMPQLGKKILASGNGRCNLLNDDFSEFCYNPAARNIVKSVFSKFGKDDILSFFNGIGIELYSQEGRIFPVTNQAASVLKALEMELRRLSIPVEYNFYCKDISFTKNDIIVSSTDNKKITCRSVIITGGGKAYPVLGSDGNTFDLAKKLDHTIIEPVPSAVPLLIKDNMCHYLQGQKIFANARSIIDGKESEQIGGELLFTKYGLSGTCILDISDEISLAINRHKKSNVYVSIDMVPFFDNPQLKQELVKRKKLGYSPEEILTGILPNKFGIALKDIFENNDLDAAVYSLKNRRFKVKGTKSWPEAEFTAGGVNLNEIDATTLESKKHKGIYFAGEILDVNGIRGGYNLGWAWASGFVAGQNA